MAPRKDNSGNARFSAPRTLRLLRQQRHRDTSSRRTQLVSGAHPVPCAKLTLGSRDTAAGAHGRRTGTCRSSPWGDAVQWSFLFLVLLWGCCISSAETLGRDHLMLWWFVRYKTTPLLKLMAANAHIMGTPGIASLASIPLQGELIQPPPVPRAALRSGRDSPQKARGGRMVGGDLRVGLGDLALHHATCIRSAPIETQPLVTGAAPGSRASTRTQPSRRQTRRD